MELSASLSAALPTLPAAYGEHSFSHNSAHLLQLPALSLPAANTTADSGKLPANFPCLVVLLCCTLCMYMDCVDCYIVDCIGVLINTRQTHTCRIVWAEPLTDVGSMLLPTWHKENSCVFWRRGPIGLWRAMVAFQSRIHNMLSVAEHSMYSGQDNTSCSFLRKLICLCNNRQTKQMLCTIINLRCQISVPGVLRLVSVFCRDKNSMRCIVL